MIQEEIVPQFAKRHRMSISEAQEAISVLSHPKELFIYNRERLCFLELCRWVFAHNAINWSREQLEHSREFNKKMQAYMDHFFWFESNFYKYKPVTFEMVYHKIREVLESETIQGITDEINSIWKGVKAIQKSKSTLLKKISLTRIDRNDIYFARRVIEWMEYRKISTMHDVYFITYFMEKCGERLGLSFEEVGFLRKVELLKLLRNKSKPDRIILKKRRAGVILVFNKHQPLQTYHDAQGKKLFAALQHKFDTSRFVVGVVASGVESPTISGRVGVVLDPARDAFRDNDILVTSMTRVEFVPLMKKAKAIVTDEGGIACHAAIVCRELGIPCIIGTKNATKKLKNGDKVTLDLRTGNIYRS
ncbi:MAG TPA: hypothetical protein DEF59_01805 [Candidatus Magasanikbacteria bacterium]|nr:hypothetical protein [Candidatus Magasanikbacteria bacterium]